MRVEKKRSHRNELRLDIFSSFTIMSCHQHAFIRSFNWALCGSKFDALSICVCCIQIILSSFHTIIFALDFFLPRSHKLLIRYWLCVCVSHSYFDWMVRAHINIPLFLLNQPPPMQSSLIWPARSCSDWLILDYLLCIAHTQTVIAIEVILSYYFITDFWNRMHFSMDFICASQ